MSNYVKNILMTFNRQILSLIIGVLTSVIIARYLGIENRGIYALILLLPTTIFTFLNIGINSSIIYFIGNKFYRIENILRSMFFVTFILIFISIITGIIIVFFYKNLFFQGIENIYLFYSLFFIPPLLYNSVLRAVFVAHENFKILNNILILQPIIFLLLIVINLLFDYKLEGVMFSELLSQYLVLLITYYIFKKNYTYTKGIISKKIIFSKIKYGMKNHIANMISFFEYRLDILMVSYFLSLQSIGAYTVAVSLAEKLWLVSSTVSSVMFARVVNLTDKKEKVFITNLSAKVVFIISLFIALSLFLTSKFIIISLFGQEYMLSVLPFIYLLPGVVLWSVVKIYASYIAGEGKPEYNIYVSLISIIFNVIFNFILIPKFGLSGAAIATSIAYGINFVIRFLVFKYMTKLSFYQLISFDETEIKIICSFLNKIKIKVFKYEK